VFVAFAVLPGESLALRVARDGARIVALPGGEEISEACEAVRAHAAGRPVEDVTEDAGKLAAMLLEPLDVVPTTRALVLCPEGPLCRVPWTVLPGVPAGAALSLTPSASFLVGLRTGSRTRGARRLVVGRPLYAQNEDPASLAVYVRGRPLPDLPETEKEVAAVARSGDVRLIGGDATEEGLRRHLGRPERWQSLHVACHGLVDAYDPSMSALALTPAPGDDGFLTALEIAALDLRVDLAVLSACDVAGDRDAPGEGLLGLNRAFLMAGAPRVLSNLWRAEDRAARALMTTFYALWQERPGAAPAALLRVAQERLREADPAWRHPAYWGGWVVWGLPD
jgi:CHAT domain-containing protein